MHRCVRVLSLGCVLFGLVSCSSEGTAPTGGSAIPPAPIQPTPAPQLAPTSTEAPIQPTLPLPTPTDRAPMSTIVSDVRRGWSPIVTANDGPPARYDHSAVLDSARQQVVIFGGHNAQALGDTWIFDLTTSTWHAVEAAGPAPRFGHGAVYDATNRRMLVVMGQGETFFNDVWAFDLDQETWTELAANAVGTERPRPRYGQSAVLDAEGRVLISHGFSDQGRFDDTWAFDVAKATWVELTPASGPKPLKRCLHTLVYEATSDRMLLFGGCSSGFGPCPQGDLWAFDLKSAAWSELTPNGAAPAARSNASLVYEPASQSLFLFGGKTEDDVSDETWSYGLSSHRWTQWENSKSPTARSNQATAYDPSTGRVFVFGGLSAEGSIADVWEWSP